VVFGEEMCEQSPREVSQDSHRDVTEVTHGCHRDVEVMLQGCYGNCTHVLHIIAGFYSGVRGVLQKPKEKVVKGCYFSFFVLYRGFLATTCFATATEHLLRPFCVCVCVCVCNCVCACVCVCVCALPPPT
jgi:hypothetical protein